MARRIEKIESEQYTYEGGEVNWLTIPPEVEERFLANGLKLRWCRVAIKNEMGSYAPDAKNIFDRKRDGFEFVDPQMVPELVERYAGAQLTGFGEAEGRVCVGDVALMAIPIVKLNARTKYFRDRAKAQEKAVDDMIRTNNLENNNSSQVMVGRKPSIQD